MIIVTRDIVVNKNTSSISEPIYLYRGDANVCVHMKVVMKAFYMTHSDEHDVLNTTNTGNVIIAVKYPDKNIKFTSIAPVKDNIVEWLITPEMIDELTEVGDYTIQIRLIDESKNSILTIPQTNNVLKVMEPLAIQETITDEAITDQNKIYENGKIRNAFDEDGYYIKRGWNRYEIIGSEDLNYMEEAIYYNSIRAANAEKEVQNTINELNETNNNVNVEEGLRVQNENERIQNEDIRVTSETKRQNDFNIMVDTVNSKIEEVTNTENEIKENFENLMISKQQDAEVILARGESPSLKDELKRIETKPTVTYEEVNDSYLSISDCNEGYLENIEISGNTIQSEENLADIYSVGEKVEGQELYEIPILSCGKNLFDGSFIFGQYNNGIFTSVSNYLANEKPIRVTQNTRYYIKRIGVAIDKYTRISYYDYSMNYLSSDVGIDRIFITPQNCFYINFHNEKPTNETEVKIMICESEVATEYEPYIEDKITILSPTQLEKVGDVADRIICKDGVWGVEKNIRTIRNVGKSISDVNMSSSLDSNNLTKIVIPNNQTFKGVVGCQVYVKGNRLIRINKPSDPIEYKYDFDSSTGYIWITVPTNVLTNDLSNLMDGDIIFMYYYSISQFIPLPHSQQVKLRTFANKTNISFLTEIEGTIKAQVPKSLGATVSTHTTQIDNLNKELDRVKKLEESTVSTVTTESDFTVVEQTSNGYFEDVRLDGKTLVNLWDINKIQKSGQTTIQGNKIKITTTENIYSNFFYEEKTLFKPSTEYTIVVDITKNTLQSNDIIFITSYSGSGTDAKDIFSSMNTSIFTINGDKTGVFIKKLTTASDLSVAKYSMRSFLSNVSQTVGSELDLTIAILEGDHTQNPPSYFEGLMSVGDDTDEIVVSSAVSSLKESDGKWALDNEEFKFNTIKWLDGYIHNISDKIILVSKRNATNPWISNIEIPPNSIIKISSKLSEGEYIYNVVFRTSHGWNCSDGKKRLGYILKTDYIEKVADKKQLLFYNTETQTWEKPVLREWDTIEKHSDGKYYYHKRSGEVVLNGSEGWSISSNGVTVGAKYYFIYNNTNVSQNISNGYATVSDKIPSVAFSDVWYGRVSFGISSSNSSSLGLRVCSDTITSVEGFKQWLQTNNVTVVYQLAEEKVYECINIDLITYTNETNYIINSGVISPKSTLKVSNSISNIITLLMKKVSLLESIINKG